MFFARINTPLSLFWLLEENTTDQVAYKQQKCPGDTYKQQQLWRREVPDQSASRTVSGEGPLHKDGTLGGRRWKG